MCFGDGRAVLPYRQEAMINLESARSQIAVQWQEHDTEELRDYDARRVMGEVLRSYRLIGSRFEEPPNLAASVVERVQKKTADGQQWSVYGFDLEPSSQAQGAE